MNVRETLGWSLVGILAAAFFAIEVFLLSSVVETIKDLNERMWALECEARDGRAGKP